MSNDCSNYSVAGRYRTVRKHLDSLGYKQALSLDSLPLIELLLVDLAQTKESLKHFQSIAKDNVQACSQLQLAIDPYKCDNARLVQECNQLHLELIETREANQKQSNEYKKRIRKLESELSDLQLSFSKNLQRIKQLEIESSNKSKKILELQGKCCKPIVNNANLATKKRPCYPLRRPVLESEPLPRTSSSTPSFSSRNVEPYVVDFVSMADHRISCLNNEVKKLKEDLYISNEHIQSLKSQLNSKDKEMSRLRKMLEGGRPCTSINKDHCCLVSEKQNGYRHDSDDDDLLKIKLNLEQQLKEALNKQHDAMSQAMKLAERNEELEKELNNIDRLALAVEADCNSTVKENNRRVCRLQEKLEDLMTQVHVLESELTVQRREAQELRADLEACRLEKSNVQRVLESTLEEKKQMTDRINNLTLMESKLNDEVNRLQKENELQKNKIQELEKNKQLEKSAQTKSVVKNHCKLNNYKPKEKQEKAETNARTKFIKKPTPATKIPENSSNQQDRSEARQSNNSEYTSHREGIDKASTSKMDKIIREKNVIIESLQNTIERIESERDHFKSEYAKFKDQLKKDTEKDNDDMWSQICELRAQLSEKEHAISKLLRDKKELCQEKFKLESQLQSQRGRSTSPCNVCRCLTPPMTERKSSFSSSKVERLERERDNAKADVQRLIEERDALRERLKLATEMHVSERRRFRESLDESESRLAQTSLQRRQLLIAQESRRAALSGRDEQLEDLKEELNRTRQELSEQRTQYFQLRTLQDQTDQALADAHGQLTQCENELTAALDRNKNLERQQLQLDNQIKELRRDINTHRTSMAQLDREKDQLLMDLDERTEKIAALEREIVFKDQQINNMEQQIREISHTKEICVDQAADMERQMRSMQLDMDNLQRQLSSASLDRENAIQENRRLADDLAAMSCEVRNMHKELEAAKIESHDLKRQLQTYVSEVRRAEELLSQKENERTEMLNHFRSLSLEASVLENNNHSLESEAAEARGALQSARDQIADLERQLSDKDCLIRGYEAQITELTQNVASLEIQLQTAQDQRLRAEEDLRTVRDLCMTLEQQKECISQRLDENSDLKNQYELQLARYRSEQEIFQEQLNRDHKTIDRLENLLEDARRETMNTQANSRELQNEVSRLKNKIADVQTKLNHETCEVRKYQTQAAEYSKQVSELRRQVNNERFDRARRQEENQRCSKALVPLHQQRCASDSSDEGISNSCACSGNETSGSEGFKIRITEVPCKAANQNCRYFNNSAKCCKDNQRQFIKAQAISRACFCSGKTKIGDIIASTKTNPNIECRNLDVQKNMKRQLQCCEATTDGSARCGRCGGRKKQRQTNSSYWITETLNLMNKLVEKKRRARMNRCENDIIECKPVAVKVNIVKQNEATQCLEDKNIKECSDAFKTKQSIKYSLIETCNSNCSVSTQTVKSIVTISDISRPHLLKILQDIQIHAKNIEEYFCALNNTLKRSNNCPDNKQNQDESKEQVQNFQHLPEYVQALTAAIDLPSLTPISSKQSIDSDISNLSEIIPYASTPQHIESLSRPTEEPPLRLESGGSGFTEFDYSHLNSQLHSLQESVQNSEEQLEQIEILKDNSSIKGIDTANLRQSKAQDAIKNESRRVINSAGTNVGNLDQIQMVLDQKANQYKELEDESKLGREVNFDSYNDSAEYLTLPDSLITNFIQEPQSFDNNDINNIQHSQKIQGSIENQSRGLINNGGNLEQIRKILDARDNPSKRLASGASVNGGNVERSRNMRESRMNQSQQLTNGTSINGGNLKKIQKMLGEIANQNQESENGSIVEQEFNYDSYNDSTEYFGLPGSLKMNFIQKPQSFENNAINNIQHSRKIQDSIENQPRRLNNGGNLEQIRKVLDARDNPSERLASGAGVNGGNVERSRNMRDSRTNQSQQLPNGTSVNGGNLKQIQKMLDEIANQNQESENGSITEQQFSSSNYNDSSEYLRLPASLKTDCTRVPESFIDELEEMSEHVDSIQEKIERLRKDVCSNHEEPRNNEDSTKRKRK